MSKTALFQRVQRALMLASAAEARHLSRSELDERRELALSRRALLRASVALSGGAAVSPLLGACRPAVRDGAGARTASGRGTASVVIVGAGLAGLTCAYRLLQRGIAARVFDANARLGGRTFTLHGSGLGSRVELGGEFIDSGHKRIQKLGRELGLSLVDLPAATRGLTQERYFIRDQHYTERDMIEAFRPVARVLQSDFAALGEPTYASYASHSAKARELDRLSIRQWLSLHRIAEPIRTLLDVAYTAEYGLETEQQSYLNLLYLIDLQGDPFLLYGDSDEAFTILEGNASIAERLAARLPTGVQLESRLEAVKRRADGSLWVSLSVAGTSVELAADRLVLALPFNQLRKADLRVSLSTAKRRALANLRYGTNAKLMAGTASRPWLATGSTGTSFNDAIYHESWDAARGFPDVAGVAASFSGGKLGIAMGSGTADFQARRFLSRLDRVYPGTSAVYTGHAVRFHWPTAKLFEGSYACYGPTDYTSFLGSEGEAEGNVHFCGEHTSTEAQGYMEGAVESGERVATEISAALTQTRAA